MKFGALILLNVVFSAVLYIIHSRAHTFVKGQLPDDQSRLDNISKRYNSTTQFFIGFGSS